MKYLAWTYPEGAFAAELRRAMARFREKFGQEATICHVRLTDFEALKDTPGVKVQAMDYVPEWHFYLSREPSE